MLHNAAWVEVRKEKAGREGWQAALEMFAGDRNSMVKGITACMRKWGDRRSGDAEAGWIVDRMVAWLAEGMHKVQGEQGESAAVQRSTVQPERSVHQDGQQEGSGEGKCKGAVGRIFWRLGMAMQEKQWQVRLEVQRGKVQQAVEQLQESKKAERVLEQREKKLQEKMERLAVVERWQGAEWELRRLDKIAHTLGYGRWQDVEMGKWAGALKGHAYREAGMPGMGEEAALIAERLQCAVTDVRKGTEFAVKAVAQGEYKLFTYLQATAGDFQCRGQMSAAGVQRAMWRRECRGLVMCQEGVIARPMHKFFEVGQVADTWGAVIGEERIVEAREKLDGAMVFGVVDEARCWVMLMTRGGRSQVAEEAEMFAVSGAGGNVVHLLVDLNRRGYTACFEWLGLQTRIKVKVRDTALVLTQVRCKLDGQYMPWEKMKGIADYHSVQCVQRNTELVGMTVSEAEGRVAGMDGIEGFVVQTEQGGMVKLKMNWWHAKQVHRYVRWSEGQRKREADRLQQKKEMMQYQGCRAVLKGWPKKKSPGLVLEEIKTAMKIECFFARGTGARGAIIVSFETAAECRSVIEEAADVWSDVELKLEYAYSSRSSSNSWHRIQTWWRQ